MDPLVFTVEISGANAQEIWDAYRQLIDYAIDISNNEPATVTVWDPSSGPAEPVDGTN